MYNKIDVPALIIWGAEDEVIPVGIGLRLEKALPQARMKVFPECGHVPQEEKPEDTLKLLKDFLVD
jgi:pimeloyl-ACP methyl ester carboxylesterase